MAANQAREVTVKQVAVVPSKTVPQGLSALLSLHPDGELQAVAEKMIKALEHVRTGEITTATRSVEIDGVKVETGQVIALLDGKLVASAGSVEEGCLELLEKANAADHELITLFYGQDITHADANRIADAIRNKYPGQEVEVQEGGQPHYQFIISVE
jgi:dihydroxyacetone kinase-like predicted kinase